MWYGITLLRFKVDLEVANPHSQTRVPAGVTPYLWAQALYIVGCLIEENFIKPAELDPLNRRLCTEKRPDVVVQGAYCKLIGGGNEKRLLFF